MTDGKGRNGSQIKEQYGPTEAGPNREREKREMDKHGQTGSIWQIWQEKLAVINPQDCPYLCSVVCLPVVGVVLYGWESASVQLQAGQQDISQRS